MHGEATPTSQHPDCSTGSLAGQHGAGNEIFLGGEGVRGPPSPALHSPPLLSSHAMLLAWLAYPGSLSLSLWGWRDGRKSGALPEGLEGLGSRREGAHLGGSLSPFHATLKELLGVQEGTLGKLYRLKAGLGDVSPLLVYAAGRPGLWLSATPPQLRILFDNINISVYFTLWC